MKIQKLDVIMSVYNGEEFLEESVDSILNQTFKNIRFIVVNNGSTDRTGEMLEEYVRLDPRIEVVHNEVTLSYVEGRTIAIERADTEWVAIMDADDISEPCRLERQIDYLEEHGDRIGVLSAWTRVIDHRGTTHTIHRHGPSSVEAYWAMRNRGQEVQAFDPVSVIHRPTFLAISGYRVSAVPAADFDFWLRVQETDRAIVVMPECLLRYRVHASSESVSKTLLQLQKRDFIRWNAELRRSGRNEIDWDCFLNTVWVDARYRLPRRLCAYGFVFGKRAYIHLSEKRYFYFLLYSFLSFLLGPKRIAIRMKIHFEDMLSRSV